MEGPREKMKRLGAGSLEDEELVAILIGSGIKGASVSHLAKLVSKCIKHSAATTSNGGETCNFSKIPGIGLIKSQRICAAIEFGRRLSVSKKTVIKSVRDVWLICSSDAQSKTERVWALYLNGSNELIKKHEIASGARNCVMIDIRETLWHAIKHKSCALILSHVHPSGKLIPSTSDIETTKQFRKACNLLGLKLLDHVIITRTGYISIIQNANA